MSRSDPILALCAIRKTGSVSFNQMLRRLHGGSHLETIVRFEPGTRQNRTFYRREDLERDQWIYPRLKSLTGHYLCPAVDYGPIAERFRWVTILRDPVQRYVSHYGQHVEKMGVATDFESWMSIEKHHDDQVKTIAGTADLEKAKSLLQTKFLVGFLEMHELSLRVFAARLPQFALPVVFGRRSNEAKGLIDARRLSEKFADQIQANNRLDQQLYDFARHVLWPQQLGGLDLSRFEADKNQPAPLSSRAAQRCRWGWARLKRNLLYKPFVRLQQH